MMDLSKQLWEKALGRIQTKVDSQSFNLWFKPLKINFSSETIDLLVPNAFFRDWLAERYLDLIQAEINSVSQVPLKVNLVVKDEKASALLEHKTSEQTSKEDGRQG